MKILITILAVLGVLVCALVLLAPSLPGNRDE